jgi:adiponectin receptor
MAFILTYRKPRPKFEGVLNRRRRSFSVPRQQGQQLLTWEALPVWYQDNHLVITGYRGICNSTWACIESMFSLHNETVNIWTHMIPGFAFAFGQIFLQLLIEFSFPEATFLDRFVFTTNLGCAMITMALSSLYHTLMCHSEHVSGLWLRIDYLGILTLILGSFFSGIYVGFYCEPLPRNVYWTMIIVLSLITSILVLDSRLQGLKYRPLRSWAFILTALSGFAPIIHGLCMYGWNEMWIRSGMPYWLLEGAIYGIGAFFFVTRIPESIRPGKFDIWCSSHQIFHVLVVIASLAHLYGVWDSFRWNYKYQRVCPAKF